MSEPIFVFILSFSTESSISIKSASVACPTASWMKTPVRRLSAIISNLPEGAGVASNKSVAFSPIFRPKDSMSAFFKIS